MKKFVFISTIISAVFLVSMSSINSVRADGGATTAAVIFAITEAKKAGLFDCALHLGGNQCRRLDRCNRALKVLERAKSGNETALRELHSFINASGMQKNCVSSLEGGHFGGLVKNLEALNKIDFENNRTSSDSKSIFNTMLKKYLGVHETGEIVMWPQNTGKGERWEVNSNGCIYNPWLNKYLGVHETGEIVMWPGCSTGEKWEVKSDGCIFNPFLKKYLGVHETGEIVMWPGCSTG